MININSTSSWSVNGHFKTPQFYLFDFTHSFNFLIFQFVDTCRLKVTEPNLIIVIYEYNHTYNNKDVLTMSTKNRCYTINIFVSR